jgi:hypothetical protein
VHDPCFAGLGGADVCSTLRGLKSLERLEMSEFDMSEPLARAFIEALATISSLMHVHLTKSQLGGGGAILSPLTTLSKLQDLNLQDNKLLIFRSHEAFSATLDALSPRLTSLNLSRCGIADEELGSLGPSLARMTRLRELDISRNHFRAMSFAELIAHVSCLTQLENFMFEVDDRKLDNDAAVNDGLGALAAFLPQLQGLTHLQTRPAESLNQKYFPLKACSMLVGAFVQIPALRHVDIYHCQVNGHEMQKITQPLRRLTAVTSLAMTYIRVEAATAEALMSALACMTGLQNLKLGVCPPYCSASAPEHAYNLTCMYKNVHVYSSCGCVRSVWQGVAVLEL